MEEEFSKPDPLNNEDPDKKGQKNTLENSKKQNIIQNTSSVGNNPYLKGVSK